MICRVIVDKAEVHILRSFLSKYGVIPILGTIANYFEQSAYYSYNEGLAQSFLKTAKQIHQLNNDLQNRFKN